jgi:hypothetical protein
MRQTTISTYIPNPLKGMWKMFSQPPNCLGQQFIATQYHISLWARQSTIPSIYITSHHQKTHEYKPAAKRQQTLHCAHKSRRAHFAHTRGRYATRKRLPVGIFAARQRLCRQKRASAAARMPPPPPATHTAIAASALRQQPRASYRSVRAQQNDMRPRGQ